MSQSPLIVFARMKSRKDQIDATRKGLLSLVEPTRKEPGCIQYDLHQSTEDKTIFYFYEKWSDDAAMTAHLQTPHVQKMLKEVPQLLAEAPEIQRVQKA
jgi:quinol monooxygenase YgiN